MEDSKILLNEKCYFYGETSKYFNFKEDGIMAKIKLPR